MLSKTWVNSVNRIWSWWNGWSLWWLVFPWQGWSSSSGNRRTIGLIYFIHNWFPEWAVCHPDGGKCLIIISEMSCWRWALLSNSAVHFTRWVRTRSSYWWWLVWHVTTKILAIILKLEIYLFWDFYYNYLGIESWVESSFVFTTVMAWQWDSWQSVLWILHRINQINYCFKVKSTFL